MVRRKYLRTAGVVLGTAIVVSAAPALARTVVDFARNAGHVDGLRAIAATRCPPKLKFGQLPPCPKRSGVVVATNARGYLPNDVVLRARDARRLGGLGPKRFAQMCGQGSIAGYAQVPGDVGSSWTEVGGYGRSLFEGGPYPGIFRCAEYTPMARQVSPGVYLVSLNVGCGGSTPPPGGTVPAVVTVNSDQNLVATYTSLCDSNDRGWEQRVQIRASDGTPTDTDFTIEELEPIAILAP